jgi:hypothetical protein
MAASLTASPKLYRLTSPPAKRGLAGCDRHHRHRQAGARVGVMKDKIEGPPSPDKRFRVKRDMAGSDILASSIRFTKPLLMFATGAAGGAMSFWTFRGSCGLRTEHTAE